MRTGQYKEVFKTRVSGAATDINKNKESAAESRRVVEAGVSAMLDRANAVRVGRRAQEITGRFILNMCYALLLKSTEAYPENAVH